MSNQIIVDGNASTSHGAYIVEISVCGVPGGPGSRKAWTVPPPSIEQCIADAMPTLEELDRMASEPSSEWLSDTSWVDYDR